jgi:hypothetical protein
MLMDIRRIRCAGPAAPPGPAKPIAPDAETRQFYVDAMRALDRAGVPYLVGGGYAMAYYTGIARNTKDLDLFLRPADRDRALTTLTAAGYRTEFFYPFWIAKALSGEHFIDLLYNSGNGLCAVDDEWFTHALPADVLDHPSRLVAPEEQLWSKAFIQDRDRFDGADVIHLILGQGEQIDWPRLVRRFAGHERVLLAHLILFGYAYPSEQDRCVPAGVLDQVMELVNEEAPVTQPRCRGALLAHSGSYAVPLNQWGYLDARLRENGGPLTAAEIAQLPG